MNFLLLLVFIVTTFSYKPLYCLIGNIRKIPIRILKELDKKDNLIYFTHNNFIGDEEINKNINEYGYAFYREFDLIKGETKIIQIIKEDNKKFNKL